MNTSSTGPDDRLRAELASLRIDRDAPPRRSRRNPIRRFWWIGLIVAAAGVAFWRLQGAPVLVAVAEATRISAVEAGPLPVLSGSGYVVTGDRYVSIGVRVPGRIERYFVEEGQSVLKGDPLVQLDDRDYRAAAARAEASLNLARANLNLAEADLRRIHTLFDKGVASRQELDIQENRAKVARATVSQIEAEVEQAKVNLDYTVLRAPTDGVILAKSKEVGEIAVPGGFAGSGDLIRLANLTDMRAQVDVNEADLNRVHMGQPASVIPDAYPDAKYDARVVKLYPQVDRQKGTLRIEVRIQNPDEKLLPDMSARITFLSEPKAGPNGAAESIVSIPSSALRRNDSGQALVWVYEDGRVKERPVESAGSVGDEIRISKGLSGGELVIVSDRPLRDGQRVRLRDGG